MKRTNFVCYTLVRVRVLGRFFFGAAIVVNADIGSDFQYRLFRLLEERKSGSCITRILRRHQHPSSVSKYVHSMWGR